jgi:hypothetical protein
VLRDVSPLYIDALEPLVMRFAGQVWRRRRPTPTSERTVSFVPAATRRRSSATSRRWSADGKLRVFLTFNPRRLRDRQARPPSMWPKDPEVFFENVAEMVFRRTPLRARLGLLAADCGAKRQIASAAA